MAQLVIRPIDPHPDRGGFPLNHPYVEHVYAGVVGPTSVLILRRADLLFRAFPEGIEIEPGEFAQSLGLGPSSGKHSVLSRTLGRLNRFGLARWDVDANTLGVPLKVPPVGPRLLNGLPESTQAVHRSLLSSLQGIQHDTGRATASRVASVGAPAVGPSTERKVPAPPTQSTPTIGLQLGV